MSKNKQQQQAAAAKRKVKQAEILAAKTLESKKKQVAFDKLVDVVQRVNPVVQERFKAHIDSLRIDIDSAGGACITLSELAQNALLDHGIEAQIVGGRAAFGFNTGKWGSLDFGFNDSNIFHPYAEEGIQSFVGHSWLEVDDFDVVIDFSLPHLSRLIALSNQAMGITAEQEILIDINRIIIHRNEMQTLAIREVTMIGYYYSKPDQIITERVHELIKLSSDH